MASKKVNVKTVKPESDEKVVSKVKKEKAKKEKTSAPANQTFSP